MCYFESQKKQLSYFHLQDFFPLKSHAPRTVKVFKAEIEEASEAMSEGGGNYTRNLGRMSYFEQFILTLTSKRQGQKENGQKWKMG